MARYTFRVDLVFEPSSDAVEASVTYETDDPQAILDGRWPDGFARYILDNISIVPMAFDEADPEVHYA